MTDKIIVFVTCESKDQAETIAQTVVTEKLAACVNVLPGVRSCYMWQREVSACLPASGPSGHLLPKGEGHAPQVPLIWRPIAHQRHSRGRRSNRPRPRCRRISSPVRP